MDKELKTAIDLLALTESAILDAIAGGDGLDAERGSEILKVVSLFLLKHCRFSAYASAKEIENRR